MRDRLIELMLKSNEKFADVDCTPEEAIVILADYLLENGVIVPPCKVGDMINGEIVCQIEYTETLGFEGQNNIEKTIHTCDKDSTEKVIFTSHPMTWEKAEQALKGGAV